MRLRPVAVPPSAPCFRYSAPQNTLPVEPTPASGVCTGLSPRSKLACWGSIHGVSVEGTVGCRSDFWPEVSTDF